uniref:Uncharacterized protein n=1 Tax=Arundo donax TaxID=35708 RepID=A0A0A8Y0T1_ARUDO
MFCALLCMCNNSSSTLLDISKLCMGKNEMVAFVCCVHKFYSMAPHIFRSLFC